MMPSFHVAALPPDLQQTLRLALEFRRGGRLDEAEALYRNGLVRHPRQPNLLGHLGELLMQKGNFTAAQPLLEQVRQMEPGVAQHWLLLTQCLLALGHAKDAKKLISEAIGKGLRHPMADELLRQARSGHKQKAEKPVPLNEALRQLDALFQAGRYAEMEAFARVVQRRHAKAPRVWYLLGMAALAQGRYQDAIQPLWHAVEHEPGMAPAQFNLGFALEELGRFDEALEAYRRTIEIAPQLADAHNNLGNVLQKLNRSSEALVAYDRALVLRPESAGYHMNRGDALRGMERLEEAISAYERALNLQPGLVEVHVNLALVLHLLGRYEESIEVSQRAIKLRPKYFDAYQGLGHALRRLKRYEDAAAAYRYAAELRPDEASSYISLGATLRDASRHDGALTALQRALELKPDSAAAINLFASTLLDLGRYDKAIDVYHQGLALLSRDPEGFFSTYSNLLLVLNYRARDTPETLLAKARVFGEKAAQKAVRFVDYDNPIDPDRRLRVGLVSGDLGQHPVGYFLQNVLEHLASDKLELFVYATAERKDALNERLRRSIPHWHDASVAKMSDEVLANKIRADGIDILIDLAGHTSKNRLPVFAWKAAPVQVTWLGYLGTTGLDTMDYILADRWALPHGEERQFTETPWRLPETYICFSPPDLTLEVEPLAALGEGYVTFGCFNNLNKISDQVVACWARVLQAVPGGRLYLKTKTLGVSEVREKLVSDFGRFGIAPERLILDGQFANHEEHFRAYHRVDIALDPFPYPGITTTVEALWMGVPVLSMKGDRFISHQGESILNNVGLPEWIAADEDDYVAKAVAFSGDIQELGALRAGLRERLRASPLCDAPRFAGNLEHALRGMWQKWCWQQKPSEVAN
ncbi:MAG: tetratricopeptide repeat protein [Thiobacillus sp.]|uniref:tetratricopeptide repeat protein n=1 Tax=Thiobacillus sp. TaxID=924 RepID=UPI00273379B7|nr:tetratricopeptide repeat protein [Thiobacillus sp.]MDP3586122.1 tetratricopeptide repeat protein [Thiobacillus sp.]